MKIENVAIRNREMLKAAGALGESAREKLRETMFRNEIDSATAYANQFIHYVRDGDDCCDAELVFVCAGMWLALRSLLKLYADNVVLTEKYKFMKSALKECVDIKISRNESEDDDV